MHRRPLCLLLALALAAPSLHAYPGAPKGPVTEEARAEAKQRVKVALGAFDQGDHAGALAELRKAWELTGSPLVLYNIGLVLDAKGDYPEADAVLGEVLALSPDPLKPEARKRAIEAQAHARARIGTIEIAAKAEGDASLAGAVVELDGLDVGRWPLPAPLRVAIGEHTVGLVAAGFAPARKKVLVAGGVTAQVTLALVPSTIKVAQLTIKCAVPAAEVLVDGEPVGRSPLPASIAVLPGKHVVEARRPGYSTASTVLMLTADGTATAELDLREDAAKVGALGARLVLAISEPSAVVTVDGVPREASAPIPLPPGPHRLHVERAGFLAVDREVTLSAGKETTLEVRLSPTASTQAAHDDSVRLHRTWGFVGAGVGGAMLVGSGVWLGLALGQRTDIRARIDAFNDRCPRATTQDAIDRCNAEKAVLDQDQQSNAIHRTLATVGLAVGVVGLGLGLFSLLTSPDPNRYKVKARADEEYARLSVTIVPGYAGLLLHGAF